MRAFLKAYEMHAAAIEVDVRQTQDGHLVAFHDARLKRLTGDPRRVCEVTLAEYRKLTVLGREPALTLEELVHRFSGACDIILDLKESGLEARVVDLIVRHGIVDRCVVSSFFPRILARIRRLNPSIMTALIAGPLSIIPLAVAFTAYVRAGARRAGTRMLHLHYRRILTPGYRRLAKHGYRLAFWTIDDPTELRRALSLGPEAIITNRPDLAHRVISSGETPQ